MYFNFLRILIHRENNPRSSHSFQGIRNKTVQTRKKKKSEEIKGNGRVVFSYSG